MDVSSLGGGGIDCEDDGFTSAWALSRDERLVAAIVKFTNDIRRCDL